MTRNRSGITTTLTGVGFAALAFFAPGAATPVAAQRAVDLAPGEATTGGNGILCNEGDGGTGCRSSLEAALAKRKPEGPVPRTAWDGKPDFNGVYYPQATIVPAPVPMASLYRPETRAARAKLNPDEGPTTHCAPSGPGNGGMTAPHPIQVIQGPGIFVMIDEQFNSFRIIPTDGRPHNPAHKPSFQGDAVGRWEGDTLVVDVTNFNEFQRLGSKAMRITERWTKPDAHTLEYEAVIEDPTNLTGPFTSAKLRRGRLAEQMLQESICSEEDSANVKVLESEQGAAEEGLLRK